MTTARRIDRQPKRVRPLTTIGGVVDDLIARWREPARKEQRWFAAQSSLKAAITTAGMAVDCRGKRLPQRKRNRRVQVFDILGA